MKSMEFPTGTRGGWVKSPANPIIGGEHGTCFDPTVLLDGGLYRMYFGWRPQNAIGLVESEDGIHWSKPRIVLGSVPSAKRFEDHINRQVVLKKDGVYHMWYSGQSPERGPSHAWIFHASSVDGYEWIRDPGNPVLGAEGAWERLGVMCPHVIWDESRSLYRMWYSGMGDAGRMYEPDSIGYAESPDGINWARPHRNPVFSASEENPCDSLRVTACQVIVKDAWHYMFYIGFQTDERAVICLARSRDGASNWERHPLNPLVAPDEGAWDADACYKPYTIFDGKAWRLWYNGRRGRLEQIGLAIKEGEDLGF